MKNSVLKTQLTQLPLSAGVYLFKNAKGETLYIGKAKVLKKRVQSYFNKPTQLSIKTQKMLEKAEKIEWITTNNELEALILEDNLVKEHQPKYNILLRDDKNYQYIRVTVQEDFPRIDTVRKIQKDGAKYFGPKTSGLDVRKTIDFIKKVFKIRTCPYHIKIDDRPEGSDDHPSLQGGARVRVIVTGGDRRPPCLDYHIKRCLGPELGMVTKEEYARVVDQVLSFLSGKYQEGAHLLEEQMKAYARDHKFELAARCRDQLEAIRRIAEKQIITDVDGFDRDIIAYISEYDHNYFNLFQVRQGKMIHQEHFISSGGDSSAEIMGAFLRDYYSLAADIPKEIVVSIPPGESGLLEEFITSRRGGSSSVRILHPQKGKKDRLVFLAEQNARHFATKNRASFLEDERRTTGAAQDLQATLGLKNPLDRIECYDIAHLSGTETVGSMVVFKKGKPVSADYRQFRLKTTQGTMDDYASMREVIRRRLSHIPEELPEDCQMRKAKKKEEKFIQETVKKNPLNQEDIRFEQFFVVEKQGTKQIVGFCRERELSDTVHDVSVLWIDPKERGKKLGYHLMKKVIENSKQKRLYMSADSDLKEYHLAFGFEEITQAPQPLIDKVKRAGEAGIDISNNVYLAYQKKKKDTSFESVPDLIVVDGGKGQLSAAHQMIQEKGVSIPVISLAKQEEEVFAVGQSKPLPIPKNSMAGFLLQRLRDEAHRFANQYNQKLRHKQMTISALDTIMGVGPKLKERLLSRFGDWEGIRRAPWEEIALITGEEVAKRIRERA